MRYTNYLLLLLVTLFVFADCKKNPPVNPNDTYFNCKINGQDYNPDNCANCLVAEILQDSLLLVTANNGFQTLGIGINNPPTLLAQTYSLSSDPAQHGEYKNSTTTDDYYQTNDKAPGRCTIEKLDTINTIIKANFSFIAYHSFRANDSVIVTGNFNLKYHNY